ncbi:Glucose/ribitol dehydrogenase [Penicillium concentricum]|uniref:Glucose/ribitol dehydrogenase n=1 Tax=Penicillium concentricum TaxID=293559 RepID=A0A9W9S5M0_9EURO|nr:Glucose/ribitol dehydrogenase [Penicillium concentricum]KAJ5372487.1 Glucose/ribitol dehydrogenase [Penicillium concentricum]
MDSVKGRVYAVTGLGGIGLAVARQLHSQGALLSLADLSEKVLTTARETIEAEFGSSTVETITTTALDISNVSAVKDWIDSTVSHFGRLDGAANMAGTIGRNHGTGKFVDQDDAEWDMLMRVNVTGLMYCLRAQLRAITATAPGGKGSIVNASSIQGLRGFALHAGYSTTKHAVTGLTKSVSKEVGPEIRVNAVAPGSIQTPLLEMAKEIQGGMSIPPVSIPRVGTSEEVAQTVVFLLSDASSYTTGQILSVDGGWE